MNFIERARELVKEEYSKNGFEYENLDEEFLFSLFKQGLTHRIHHYKYNKRIRSLARLAKDRNLVE